MSLFSWIAIDIVLWGFMSRYLNSVASTGFDFVPALLGAVLLWDFFIRVMQGVTMAFFEDVWSRNFLNVFASPMSIPEYVGGLVLSAIATSTAGLLFMIVMAATVFGLAFFSYGILLFPFLLVLFLFGIALGVVGERDRSAAGPFGGVVRLAHPRADLSLRRCLLSARHSAGVDARGCSGAAAIVRV